MNIMDLLNIFTFGLNKVYEKHALFHKIISDFREKLPRPQNQARTWSKEEKENHPLFKGSILSKMSALDLSPHKTTLTERDLDEFYNKLINFDYEYMFFKDYYRSFVKNLIRLKPKAENKNMELVMLQKKLEMTDLQPTKPSSVLLYHMKYKWRISSWVLDKFRK
jgi:hypothetical protein